jgi:DNA-binding MurR/RpiR family transcriptional regulator
MELNKKYDAPTQKDLFYTYTAAADGWYAVKTDTTYRDVHVLMAVPSQGTLNDEFIGSEYSLVFYLNKGQALEMQVATYSDGKVWLEMPNAVKKIEIASQDTTTEYLYSEWIMPFHTLKDVDLKVTLAQSMVSPLQNVHEEVTPGDDMAKVVAKVFASATNTLQYTYETLNVAALEQAVQLLQGARRILIFGLGASASVAADLQHKLQRLNLQAQAYSDSHLQALAAAYATGEDVVFAISHSGSSRVVVDNVRIARANGAKIICLSNIGRTPLSKLSDVCLHTASTETKFRIIAISSRIAELTIIDSLYTYLALSSDHVRSLKVEKAMEGLKY